MDKVMAKQTLRVALCAALLVCCVSARARGAADGGPAVKTTPTKKGRESKIHVYLPTKEAKLYFDGTLTKVTGKDRTIRSPALMPVLPALMPVIRYTSKVVVVWVENGREVSDETTIVFTAGEDVAIDFRR
jgi:uncharacterized protein (TIGR03000 family)